MKPPSTVPAVAVVFSILLFCAGGLEHVFAIPNQIGGGGFFQMAGMRLEDFAKRHQTWKRDAKLEGKWEAWSDPAVTDRSIELLKLSLSAVVFGVPASEVTVQRREGQTAQFSVVFCPSSPGEASRLAQTVRTNAAAWSGGKSDDAALAAGATSIEFSERDDGSIVATFTPRKKSSADPS